MLVRRLRPQDFDLAARVLFHPSVAGGMRNLTEQALDAALSSPKVYVLMPDAAAVGLFHPFAGTAWEVHQAALPEARGARAVAAGKAAVAWMWRETPATALVGITPESNRAAVLMAHLVGFKTVGAIPQVFPGGEAAVVTEIHRATP